MKGVELLSPCLPDAVAALGGAAMGAIGFLPLLAAVLAARRPGARPTVAWGLVAVAVSTVFLASVGAAVWVYDPKVFLPFVVGGIIGFFVMWALLAAMSLSRR